MKNKTRIDKKTMLELIKTNNKIVKRFMITIGSVLTLFGILLIPYGVKYNVFIVCGLLLVIIFAFLIDNAVLNQNKGIRIFNEETYYHFDFGDSSFTVNTICSDELYSYSIHRYYEIVKIRENKKFLFIFISKAQAFILSKNSMTEGRFNDLKSLLKRNVKKYKSV